MLNRASLQSLERRENFSIVPQPILGIAAGFIELAERASARACGASSPPPARLPARIAPTDSHPHTHPHSTMIPRHSQARASRLSRLKSSTPLHPVLASMKQKPRSTREKFGFEPKDFQVAAVKAQIEGVDMTVQASTGAGRTAIAAGPHLWPGNDGKFTIMTRPLLSLPHRRNGECPLSLRIPVVSSWLFQIQTFESDYGLKAIALNSKNGGHDAKKIAVSPFQEPRSI